jgi:hypothetical protein
MIVDLSWLWIPGSRFARPGGRADWCAIPEPQWLTSPLRRPPHHDPLIQFLIHDLNGAVDFGIGHAELMRNQFHQEVDPLDERGAACDRAGGR